MDYGLIIKCRTVSDLINIMMIIEIQRDHTQHTLWELCVVKQDPDCAGKEFVMFVDDHFSQLSFDPKERKIFLSGENLTEDDVNSFFEFVINRIIEYSGNGVSIFSWAINRDDNNCFVNYFVDGNLEGLIPVENSVIQLLLDHDTNLFQKAIHDSTDLSDYHKDNLNKLLDCLELNKFSGFSSPELQDLYLPICVESGGYVSKEGKSITSSNWTAPRYSSNRTKNDGLMKISVPDQMDCYLGGKNAKNGRLLLGNISLNNEYAFILVTNDAFGPWEYYQAPFGISICSPIIMCEQIDKMNKTNRMKILKEYYKKATKYFNEKQFPIHVVRDEDRIIALYSKSRGRTQYDFHNGSWLYYSGVVIIDNCIYCVNLYFSSRSVISSKDTEEAVKQFFEKITVFNQITDTMDASDSLPFEDALKSMRFQPKMYHNVLDIDGFHSSVDETEQSLDCSESKVYMNDGDRIRDARKKAGFSQQELARLMTEAMREKGGTITREKISKWETGKEIPWGFQFKILAEILSVDVGFLDGSNTFKSKEEENDPIEKKIQKRGLELWSNKDKHEKKDFIEWAISSCELANKESGFPEYMGVSFAQISRALIGYCDVTLKDCALEKIKGYHSCIFRNLLSRANIDAHFFGSEEIGYYWEGVYVKDECFDRFNSEVEMSIELLRNVDRTSLILNHQIHEKVLDDSVSLSNLNYSDFHLSVPKSLSVILKRDSIDGYFKSKGYPDRYYHSYLLNEVTRNRVNNEYLKEFLLGPMLPKRPLSSGTQMALGGALAGGVGAVAGYAKGEKEKKEYYEQYNQYINSQVKMSAMNQVEKNRKLESGDLLLLDLPMGIVPLFISEYASVDKADEKTVNNNTSNNKGSKKGCYVATAVYGSYDCPEVWTLRRYRDSDLSGSWYGRLFIRIYYMFSPTIVKWFGDSGWFKKVWKRKLDRMVKKLQDKGYKSTPYKDREW